MTAAGTYPENWTEVCMVGLIPEGGTIVNFGAMTDDISAMDWADKDFEGRALVNGGRVRKQNPQGDESITLKITPVSANADNSGAVQFFHPITGLDGGKDATDPIVVPNSRFRQKFGVILLWAKTLPATAATVPADGVPCYRIQIRNAQLTSYKPSFDDKDFTAEVTFKWTPFDKDGYANKKEESSKGATGSHIAAGITSATALFA